MTPFDWRRFLDLADWLDEGSTDPAPVADEDARLRTVVGRAYYAAFHVAHDCVRLKVSEGVLRWPSSRRSIHDKVWEALKSYPDLNISELGRAGAKLKQERTEADYSVAPNKRRTLIAREARRFARDIIDGLDASTVASR